ncbi:MAG: alpha-beta hydrolase superfamily lysophospholipase [Enterobacterales bacterium]
MRGHKPFAVIADHLTRQGIAVLRYDDRGVAKSKGDHHSATSLDFASDANAAFKFLTNRDDIDTNAIGMIGHSEGGLIAPLAFNTNKELAYIILLAGPGINTLELMLAQQKAMSKSQGIPEKKFKKIQHVTQEIMEKVSTSANQQAAIKAVSDMLSADNLAILGVEESQKSVIIGSYTKPWYRYFMTYDPADYFDDKKLPILALGGELDVQVTSKENLAGLRNILKDHNDATVTLLPGLNHMFQQAKTGSINEYSKIEQTFSPEALTLLSSWINTRF